MTRLAMDETPPLAQFENARLHAMFAELETTRLNVEDKNRSNLFSWRGQFTPQFVDYLLETYARPGQRILDPFCGSGTVLQEAAARRLPAVGLEINPAAYAMAKFFAFSGLSPAGRKALVEQARESLHEAAQEFGPSLPLFQDAGGGYRESASNLLDLARRLLSGAGDKPTRLLLLLALFRAESAKAGELVATVSRALRFLSDQLLRLPGPENPPIAKLADARDAHTWVNQAADVIITSPPYINVFNYHQNYRALLELAGFDMLKVAHSELGSNRKHRSNRFLTVIQYCLDIELALHSFAKALAPNGLLIMVLGRESRVRGVAFGNSKIVASLIRGCGAFVEPQTYERVFVNRFGQSIFEDILVARRRGESDGSEHGREVAISCLQHALNDAVGEVRADIEEALALAASVRPSPLFNKSELI
jgi:SAM-dependent methyltransferase